MFLFLGAVFVLACVLLVWRICRNPDHYSGLARLMGASGVARLQEGFGAKVRLLFYGLFHL